MKPKDDKKKLKRLYNQLKKVEKQAHTRFTVITHTNPDGTEYRQVAQKLTLRARIEARIRRLEMTK